MLFLSHAPCANTSGIFNSIERLAAQEAAEEEERERDIALGHPLLNKPDFNLKRRWDDDVVFKNQARGTEDKGKKKEFINVSLQVAWLVEDRY